MEAAAGGCLRQARFEFRTREEAAAIAQAISLLLPKAHNLEFVVLELMLNAVEHGNLEIGAELKAELVRSGDLDHEIASRASRPPYGLRVAWVDAVRRGNDVILTIGDEGPGFCWSQPAPESPAERPSGRGLALARALSPCEPIHNEAGNVVTLRVPL